MSPGSAAPPGNAEALRRPAGPPGTAPAAPRRNGSHLLANRRRNCTRPCHSSRATTGQRHGRGSDPLAWDSKLRGKGLAVKPGRSRGYHVAPEAARTIAALLALRDHVIAPILAGVCSPRMGRKPKIWTPIDRRYESLRIGMQDLFRDLGIAAAAA